MMVRTIPPVSPPRAGRAILIAATMGTGFLLSACVSTAASIITAPVRAVGRVADWTTTSQDESDRALGRRVRARDAEIGRLERQRVRAASRCRDGNEGACGQAADFEEQISELRNAPLD